MHDRMKFGPFEFDREAGRLLKHGAALKVAGQPLQVLGVLIDRPGEVVTREELRRRLWDGDTFVDFEHGLNAAVNKLRFALHDAADKPRYIETIPRRGYRFVGSVTREQAATPHPSELVRPAVSPAPGRPSSRQRWVAIAGALAASLLALWAAGAGSSSRQAVNARITLVVLPFEDLSDDRTQKYFGEGLTDEMITLLGQLDPERLGVIARTSAFRYSGTRSPVPQIAAELGVDYVVEGSIRRAGDRVRVSAQLIRGSDATHLWADSYDRDVRDFLGVQKELARAIAQKIEVRLPVVSRDAHQPTPEAYEAYLRGRYLLGRRTADAIVKGHHYLQEAVRLDPAFALAHAGLSQGYQHLTSVAVSPSEAMPQALAAARKSLTLDPDLAEGHAAVARILSSYAWNWTEADRAFRRALELSPNSVDTRIAYAAHLSHVGRLDEAVAEARRALRLDPVSLAGNAQLAVILYRARRYDEALQQLQAMSELDPDYPVMYLNLGLVYAAQGRYVDAIAAFETGRRIDRHSTDLAALLGYALGRAGKRARATAILEELQVKAVSEFVHPFTIGLVHLGLEHHDDALEWIERGYEKRSWMTALVKMNPELDALRGDPRFQALVRRLDFPE